MVSRLRLLTLALLVGAITTAAFADWPQWGRTLGRNPISPSHNLPASFHPGGKMGGSGAPAHIAWAARLGTWSYATPVVAGGRVFIGANNATPRNPARQGDRGVLMCFSAATGKFLWQFTVPRVAIAGMFCADYPGLALCSAPTVVGNRVYLVTNRAEVVCLDVAGMANGNDGPFRGEASFYAQPKVHRVKEVAKRPQVTFVPGAPVRLAPTDADIVWVYDMVRGVGSWPHDATSGSVLVLGDLLYAPTGNANDRDHTHVPSPDAPSLIALDRNTGRLVATDNAHIGPHVYHGQWSSPSFGMVRGRPLVFYGGGDGFCYAFDAAPAPGKPGRPGTLKQVWRCDCNPQDLRTRNGSPMRYNRQYDGPCEIIATPVLQRDRVYVAIGEDPSHGAGKGCLVCIDATTGTVKWRFRAMGRSVSTPCVIHNLVFAPDYGGVVHCLDASTGKVLWTSDTGAKIWASPLVADGKLYVGTERSEVWVYQAGPVKKLLSRNRMGGAIHASPIAANNVLYITTQNWLYAINNR